MIDIVEVLSVIKREILRNDQINHYLEQEQQEQQKKSQNNQQQLVNPVNPVNLQPTTTAGHPHHAPKLYQTSNLQTPKITSSAISLLPTKTNVPYNIGNLLNEYS